MLRSVYVVLLVVALAACAPTPPARPDVAPPPDGTVDLSSADPYFDEVRERIKQRWGYPCVPNAATGACEHMTADLTLHFTILENGTLQTIKIVKSSGYELYDHYALNAVKLASPFSPVPPRLMAHGGNTSVAVTIIARFRYVVDLPR